MVEQPAVNRLVVGSSPTHGALKSVAKLTYRPVNREPRCREVAGFLRFPQYPQGFRRHQGFLPKPARAPESAGLSTISLRAHLVCRELSDSRSKILDPVNNPVAFAPPKATLFINVWHGDNAAIRSGIRAANSCARWRQFFVLLGPTSKNTASRMHCVCDQVTNLQQESHLIG